MIVVDPVTMLVFEIACLWFFIICGVLCFHLGFLSDWWGPLTEVFLILIGIRVASFDDVRYRAGHGRVNLPASSKDTSRTTTDAVEAFFKQAMPTAMLC